MTDEFLDALAADLVPVSFGYVARRLVTGIGVGVLLSAALVLPLLGMRPDIRDAMTTGMFWLKQIYTLTFGLIAGLAVERLARPAVRARAWLVWFAAPFLVVAGVAAIQLARAPADERLPMLLGGSASVCPRNILLSAIPLLAGLIWASRGLAPIRLREAGAAIGLAAGGGGAFIYALHCTERTAAFLTVWYTLGMVACGLLGWAAGPLLLRWR